jgi:hypothetical protein
MTGLVRKATLLAACGLLVSAAAMASVPSPCNSTLPCGIEVGGHNGTTTNEPLVTFTVTVKDLANNPVANSSVVIDFSACVDDVYLQGAPSGTQYGGLVLGPGPQRTIRTIANASGVATFAIAGAANALTASPKSTGCAMIYADGVLLNDGTCQPSTVQISAYDRDGYAGGAAMGVGPADLSLWLGDSFSAPYEARSDYDYKVLCVQDIGPADLSKWLAVSFSGSSSNGPTFW